MSYMDEMLDVVGETVTHHKVSYSGVDATYQTPNEVWTTESITVFVPKNAVTIPGVEAFTIQDQGKKPCIAKTTLSIGKLNVDWIQVDGDPWVIENAETVKLYGVAQYQVLTLRRSSVG